MEEIWRACMDMMMGSGGGFMMVFMLLFWIGVIALIVLGVRWIWPHGGGGAERESPRNILDRRYAAGQIDQEEYEERRRVLSGSGDR